MNTDNDENAIRERVRQIASEYISRGDALGWFEALYSEAAGDNTVIPWADLEPNRFFVKWAENTGLRGEGKTALVVGCGLGDDARYLNDLGFEVTAFDISPTAIEWAKKLHSDTEIRFEVMDLFDPFPDWRRAFDFVLEVYTIQPLPEELRGRAIDAISEFVAPGGKLAVVTRGRNDDDPSDAFPLPLSRRELQRFVENGLAEEEFQTMDGDEDPPIPRFVVIYSRSRNERPEVG